VHAPHVMPELKQKGTLVVDHKTGRERPQEHASQLELYSIIEFSVNPRIDYVLGEIFYVDHGKKLSAMFNDRDLMLTRFRDRWTEKAEKMLADREFAPTPSQWTCRWCAFSRAKGGPCEAG
jgi:hypothetical protein